MIGALITFVIYVIVLAVIWWLISYVLDNFPLPEPANRILRVGAVIIIVIVAVLLLLSLVGVGGLEGVPRLRFG